MDDVCDCGRIETEDGLTGLHMDAMALSTKKKKIVRKPSFDDPYNQDGTLKRRFQVLEFICEYAIEHNGNSPSTGEIALHFGFNQKTAWRHVNTLERQGYVAYQDGKLVVKDSRWIRPNERY